MSDKSALEILIEARDRLAKGWCQNHYAVDQSGRPVYFCSKAAAGWCMSGAVHASYGDIDAPYDFIKDALHKRGLSRDIYEANDEQINSQQMAVEIMEEAIGICRAASEEGESR